MSMLPSSVARRRLKRSLTRASADAAIHPPPPPLIIPILEEPSLKRRRYSAELLHPTSDAKFLERTLHNTAAIFHLAKNQQARRKSIEATSPHKYKKLTNRSKTGQISGQLPLTPPFFIPPTASNQKSSAEEQIGEVVKSALCKKCASELRANHQMLPQYLTKSNRFNFPPIAFQKHLLTTSGFPSPRSGPRIHCATRAKLINFMLYCQCRMPHPPSSTTVHVSISCFDRFCQATLRRGDQVAREKLVNNLPAVAAASLHLASKIEDVWPVDAADLAVAANGAFTTSDVMLWEKRVCMVLDFKISTPTALDFINAFLLEAKTVNGIRQHQENVPCGHCGGREAIEDNKTSKGHINLLTLGAETWDPQHRQGKGRSAIEACSLFLAELALVHPTGIDWSYDVLAATCLYIVAVTLADRSVASDELLPPSAVGLLEQPEVHIPPIVGAFAEYLSAAKASQQSAELSLESDIQQCLPVAGLEKAELLKDPVFQSFQEAMEDKENASSIPRIAAFLISRMHARGRPISAALARKIAAKVLRGDIPRPEAVAPQKGTSTAGDHPLGLFAHDVVQKHIDASTFLEPKFLSWQERLELSQSPKSSKTESDQERQTRHRCKSERPAARKRRNGRRRQERSISPQCQVRGRAPPLRRTYQRHIRAGQKRVPQEDDAACEQQQLPHDVDFSSISWKYIRSASTTASSVRNPMTAPQSP